MKCFALYLQFITAIISKQYWKMNSSNMEIQGINEYIAHSSSRKKKEPFPVCMRDSEDVLCKIGFDIDSQQEQLLIRQDTTLDEIADQLIFRIGRSNIIQSNDQQDITNDQKILLKQQIKAKIETIIQENTEKTLQAAIWRNKLKNIIQNNIPLRTPMDSLLPSSTRKKKDKVKSTKSVTYFGYRPYYSLSFQQQQNSSLKDKQNYEKIKKIHRQFMQPRSLSPLDSGKSRLYDLGKNNEMQKNYLSKMHQWFSIQKQLSQCTFHPHIRRQNGNDFQETSAKNRSCENVFSRLYNYAQDKKQKMKRIQKQLSQREEQELNHLDFIPKIDQCSKQIVKIKKQFSLAKENNIYENLYQQNHSKRKIFEKPSEWTFHPQLCPKSQKIAKQLEIIEPRNKLYQKKLNSKGKIQDKSFNSKNQKIFFQNKNQRQKKSENSFCNSSYRLLNKDKTPRTTKNNYLTEKSLNISQPSIQSDKSSFRMTNQLSTKKKLQNMPINSCESQTFLKKTLPSAHFQNHIKRQQNKEKSISCKNIKQKAFKKKKIDTVDKKQTVQQIFQDKIKSQKFIIEDDTQVTNQSSQKWMISQNTISKTESSEIRMEPSKRIKKLKNPFQFFEMQQKAIQAPKIQQNDQFFQKSALKETHHIDSLFQRRKGLIFESIFDFLKIQSAIGSEISYLSILNNSLIPENLQIILYPMAQEMRQLNVGLDKEEFIWSISRIFQNISLQERGLLLAWGLKLQPESIKSIR